MRRRIARHRKQFLVARVLGGAGVRRRPSGLCPVLDDVKRVRRRLGLLDALLGPHADRSEDPPVEQNHDQTRDVERSHRRVDQEVGVIEDTHVRISSLRVVHAERDR